MKKVFDAVKKFLLSDVSLYDVLIIIGILLLLGMLGWMFYQTTPTKPWPVMPVEVEKPQPELKPELKPELTPVPKSEEKPMIQSLEDVTLDDVWYFKLNKDAAEQVRNGKLTVRLHVGYCWYEGTEVDESNCVRIKPDWNPPLKESRISAGLFSVAKGRYVSSFLIKNASTKAPKEELREDVNPPPTEITPEEGRQRLEKAKTNTGQVLLSIPVSDASDLMKAIDDLNELWSR